MFLRDHFTIQAATLDQAQQITDLANEAYFDCADGVDKGFYRVPRQQGGERTNKNEVLEFIKNSAYKIYVCFDKEKLIGVICMRISADTHTAFLTLYALLPQYRHRGIGKLLLKYVEQQAIGQFKLKYLDLEVVSTQDRLINYYTKVGFYHNGFNRLNNQRVKPEYREQGGIEMLCLRKNI